MLKKLGKYELIAELGRGAMGEVFKARDPLIGRLVALKTITSGLLGRPDLLDRFYREAQSSGQLQHPNIVTIYELGKEGDVPFIAMQFIEGESLERLIERRPALPISQKVGFIVAVCRALDHAHKHGVVHRDIKPGNIMITKDGAVQVVDFGIARVMDDSNTQTNMLIGTLGYMSPQQIQGERADERSDIWATGVMFYELLCYRRPFNGDNQAALMMNIISKQPQTIQETVPDCPPELEALIARMLEKDIEQRFQTMEDVLLELEPLWKQLQEETISGLVVESERLFETQDFAQAQDLAREILKINSSSIRAKSLLERINLKIKQNQVLQQVHAHNAKAQSNLEEGHFPEASAEAEVALKFSSMLGPNHEVFVETRRIAEQARVIQQNVQAGTQRLNAGALTEAGQELEKALAIPGASNNPQVRALQKQIQDHLAHREARKRLGSVLQQARLLWAERRYDECIALLSGIQNDFPDEQEIGKLLETARADLAEQRRQEKLAEARGLLAAQRFDEALAHVSALLKGHPRDQAALNLQSLIQQARQEYARQQEFQAGMEAIRSLVHAANFTDAIARGKNLSREFPHEPELAELLEFARGEEEKRQLELLFRDIRRKIDSRDFPAAITFAEEGLKRFPRNADLTKLLAEAQSYVERVRSVQQSIRIIRQRLADGVLPEAELEIEKALRLEADNPHVLALKKQLQEQVGRERNRQRLSAVVQQARKCWADQRYDECISLLTGVQSEFPQEQEITKLLETARADQAEQIKQNKLGEARSLLAKEKFDEASELVALLKKQYPADRAVLNMQALISRTRDNFLQQQKLQNEIESLRSLVSESKFADAVARAEKLLQEFPEEAELRELRDFSRSEQLRVDKKRRLDEQIRKIDQQIKEQRFSAAFQSAQKALTEFPQNTDLLILLDRAKKEQGAKERRELLDQRLKEIQQKIHREELSDAIDLARQTQVIVGPDSAIENLLHKAEWESVQKKRRQDETVIQARTLLDEGKFDDVTIMLQGAVETRLFSKSDPRISGLLQEIDKKQAEATRISSPEPPSATSSSPGSDSWPSRTNEPAKDYVYQPGIPLPGMPHVPDPDATAVAFSATSLGAPQQTTRSPSAHAARDATEQIELKLHPDAVPAIAQGEAATTFRLPAPRKDEQRAVEAQATTREKPHLQIWLVGIAAVLAVLAGGFYVLRSTHPGAKGQPILESKTGLATPGVEPGANQVSGDSTDNVEKQGSRAPEGVTASGANSKARVGLPAHNTNPPVSPTKSNPANPVVTTQPHLPAGNSTNGDLSPQFPPRNPAGAAPPAPPVSSNPPVSNVAPDVPAKLPEPPSQPAPMQPSQPPAASVPSPSGPAEPVAPIPTPVNPDQQAIRSLIQEMSAAFSNRNISSLQAIWPKMGGSKNSLKAVFDSAQSLSRNFHIENVAIRPDGVMATVGGTYDGKIRQGGKESASSGPFYVRLSKRNGKWLIDDASF